MIDPSELGGGVQSHPQGAPCARRGLGIGHRGCSKPCWTLFHATGCGRQAGRPNLPAGPSREPGVLGHHVPRKAAGPEL